MLLSLPWLKDLPPSLLRSQALTIWGGLRRAPLPSFCTPVQSMCCDFCLTWWVLAGREGIKIAGWAGHMLQEGGADWQSPPVHFAGHSNAYYPGRRRPHPLFYLEAVLRPKAEWRGGPREPALPPSSAWSWWAWARTPWGSHAHVGAGGRAWGRWRGTPTLAPADLRVPEGGAGAGGNDKESLYSLTLIGWAPTSLNANCWDFLAICLFCVPLWRCRFLEEVWMMGQKL